MSSYHLPPDEEIHCQWDALFQAVVKCDHCPSREAGILQRCNRCRMMICESCVQRKLQDSVHKMREIKAGSAITSLQRVWLRCAIDQTHAMKPEEVTWDIPEDERKSSRSSKRKKLATNAPAATPKNEPIQDSSSSSIDHDRFANVQDRPMTSIMLRGKPTRRAASTKPGAYTELDGSDEDNDAREQERQETGSSWDPRDFSSPRRKSSIHFIAV